MIAILRHKHLRAVEDSGPGSGPVGRAAAALVEAYRQRANMIYIRPALAYLRTSFTASTLLENNTAWKNLLENHGYRAGLPYFPERLDEIKKKIEGEIDTQFWQNINRVQVSGVGDTNYVIAKDDIGNWYVKNFSADVAEIAKTATNLATFNIAASINAPPIGGDGAKSPETPLMKQRNRFKQKYIQELRSLVLRSKVAATTFTARIKSEAKARDDKKKQADLDKLGERLVVGDEDRLKAVMDLDVDGIKDDQVFGALVNAFDAMSAYYDTVVNRINADANLAKDHKKLFIDAVTQVVLHQELKAIVEKAIASAREFATAVIFIGDSVKSDEKADNSTSSPASDLPAPPYGDG